MPSNPDTLSNTFKIKLRTCKNKLLKMHLIYTWQKLLRIFGFGVKQQKAKRLVTFLIHIIDYIRPSTLYVGPLGSPTKLCTYLPVTFTPVFKFPDRYRTALHREEVQ